MLNAMGDGIVECDDVAREYTLKRRFNQTWGPVIEDALVQSKAGR